MLTEKNKQALIVGCILGSAILIIIIYFGFMFIKPEVDRLAQETEKLEAEYSANKKTLDDYKKYLADTKLKGQVEDAFSRVSSRLPALQDPIEVFDLLRDYIEGSDVTFTLLEPKPAKTRERFTEYPFALKGTARYHEFGQLVNLIECNPDRLMRVTDFLLTNNDKRPSVHPMEINLTTYTFTETK